MVVNKINKQTSQDAKALNTNIPLTDTHPMLERQVSYSVNKQKMTLFIGQASWAKNDITWGQANSTGMPPDQNSKQS